MDTHSMPTEAAVVAEIARQALTPQSVPSNFTPDDVVVIGGQIRDFQGYREMPRAAEGDVRLDDIESLATYVMAFASDRTRAYIDADTSEIVVVLHDDTTEGPSWRRHRANMQLRRTEDWTRWNVNNRHTFSQTEFAEFLEDNAEVITSPPSAELLEIVTKFEKVTTMTFKSSVRLADDRRQYTFREDGASEDDVILPETLTLTMPVFNGFTDTGYVMRARLRHRLTHGSLSFFYELVRPDLVLETAFDDIGDKFTEACDNIPTESDEIASPVVLHGCAPDAR